MTTLRPRRPSFREVVPRDDAHGNYAARVLLFPIGVTLVFLPGFVATDPVSVVAAAAVLLSSLSTEVERISS